MNRTVFLRYTLHAIVVGSSINIAFSFLNTRFMLFVSELTIREHSHTRRFLSPFLKKKDLDSILSLSLSLSLSLCLFCRSIEDSQGQIPHLAINTCTAMPPLRLKFNNYKLSCCVTNYGLHKKYNELLNSGLAARLFDARIYFLSEA